MGKNPRDPKAVKALIKKHSKPKPTPVIPAATLWNRIRRRKKQ